MRMIRFQLGICAILAGALYFISFPPNTHWWGAVLCAFFLTLIGNLAKSAKSAFLAGWVAGIISTLLGFPWVAYVAKEFAYLPEPVSWLVYLGFGLIGKLDFAFFTLLYFHINKKLNWKLKSSLWYLPPALYTFLEYAIPKVFPETFAATIIEQDWIRGLLDITGTLGIVFLIFWTGSNLYFFLYELLVKRTLELFKASYVILLLILIFGSTYSLWKDRTTSTKLLKAEKVGIAIIQANIGNIEKAAAEKGAALAIRDTVTKYTELSKTAANEYEADLIIWPETAYPNTLYDRRNMSYMRSLSRIINTAMLIGGYDTEKAENGDETDFNTMFLFSEKGKHLAKYRKIKLLPFGEYFPLSEYFPFLRDIVPEISNFGRGKSPKILETGKMRINPLICYEAIFPGFVLDSMKSSPNLIVNVTNDSWFGPTYEQEQHLALARIRTIEFRTPMARATNTGITALINPLGEFISKGPKDETAIIHGEVELLSSMTIYSKFGNYPLMIFSILLIILGIFQASKKRKNLYY